MPETIRSILGKTGGRVKKTKKSGSRPASSPAPAPAASAASPSASPRKAGRKSSKREKDDKEAFPDKLEDRGLARLLEEEATLRDVVQAMRYIRSRMFSPVPTSGFHSSRTADLLNYRASVPPIVTVGHLNAVLSAPSRVEREVVELLGKGVVRKVRVERRGVMGEALIESPDLEGMVNQAQLQLSEGTRRDFVGLLRGNPIVQTLSGGEMADEQADELVRAGFLTSAMQATPATTLHIRPEDRTTLTSIQRVSQFASGSLSAVGGRNAIHLAGGGGGAPTLTQSSGHHHGRRSSSQGGRGGEAGAAQFRLAIPGHGRYLKLAEGAVDWVREALGRTRWGEAPESWLRERFEGGGGGGLYGTRWKEFWGVEWEWVVGEAVGLGVVEIFETGSVGRGVRALGG
jgi:hypothetical protein